MHFQTWVPPFISIANITTTLRKCDPHPEIRQMPECIQEEEAQTLLEIISNIRNASPKKQTNKKKTTSNKRTTSDDESGVGLNEHQQYTAFSLMQYCQTAERNKNQDWSQDGRKRWHVYSPVYIKAPVISLLHELIL